MKVVVLNFSHPLTGEVLEQVRQSVVARFGEAGELVKVEQVVIPCQLDLDADLGPQCRSLFDSATEKSHSFNCDYVIVAPPALGAAAFSLGEYFFADDWLVNFMWIKRNTATPPQFVLGGIHWD